MTYNKINLTVKALIKAPIEIVWEKWNLPRHIVRWNSASTDWHTTYSENNLQPGGKLISRMESKDGSMGFDFTGTYTDVEKYKKISYEIADGRLVEVEFKQNGDHTEVVEHFEAETTHSPEMQKAGWQAILDNFKRYVEKSGPNLLYFEEVIDATPDQVYQSMLGKETYPLWTSVFFPGSNVRGNWEKGEKIFFVAPGENGQMEGMVSRIKENIKEKYVSIEHLGFVRGDQEVTTGAEVEAWAGALENYSFIPQEGKTLVIVDMDSQGEHDDYFNEAWPKALKKLKEIVEA